MRVCVLTTSYPRTPDDIAGRFIFEAVRELRASGVHVDVVSPAGFRHFGIARGGAITQNLRARPWLVLAVPLFLVAFAFAARRASRDADVVHAHWIPSGLAAIATGKPFVLQVWGTDVEFAMRARWIVRPIMRRAQIVIAASSFLAEEARALAAREIRVIANGVDIPQVVADPVRPLHVLFVGRLSPEKGILEFIAATNGLPRVIVGDGPLRGQVPEAVGFVAHDELGRYYDEAAVVCVPSRREGYGIVAREAMAHGRPVVATRVGGLPDAVTDGVTGMLVEFDGLRSAIVRLLGDSALRARLGAAARNEVALRLGWGTATERLLSVYTDVSVSAERMRA